MHIKQTIKQHLINNKQEVLQAYYNKYFLLSVEEVAKQFGATRKVLQPLIKEWVPSEFIEQRRVDAARKKKMHVRNQRIADYKERIIQLFVEQEHPVSIDTIARICKMRHSAVKEVITDSFTLQEIKERELLVRSRAMSSVSTMSEKVGVLHHNFKGPIQDGKGYILELKPAWFTGRKGSKHVFQHQLIMCKKLGLTDMPEGFAVHHVDYDKTNNAIDNLALLTHEAHQRLHGGNSHISNKLTMWELHEFMTWKSKQTTAT